MTLKLIKKAEFDADGKPTPYSFFIVYHVESKQYILKKWKSEGNSIPIRYSSDKKKIFELLKECVQYHKTLSKAGEPKKAFKHKILLSNHNISELKKGNTLTIRLKRNSYAEIKLMEE